jgi:hypothetical protein
MSWRAILRHATILQHDSNERAFATTKGRLALSEKSIELRILRRRQLISARATG